MKRAVGENLVFLPVSVSGYNLGEHGNSQFGLSQVRVNQRQFNNYFQLMN